MELLAVGTAFCLALGGLITAEVVRDVGGSVALTRWRMLITAIMLAAVTTATGGWAGLSMAHVVPALVSSFVAVVLADPALNVSTLRLGARRSQLVFSMNAPFAALLGYLVLGERLGLGQVAGGGLVVLGTIVAVAYGQGATVPAPAGSSSRARAREIHAEVGVSLVGLTFGLLAALGQAVGNLAMRPAMLDHADPFAMMTIRVAPAAAIWWLVYALSPRAADAPRGLPSLRTLGLITMGGFISMVLGMTLLMVALGGTTVAVASTLSSMMPVAVLPMLWLRTGRAPSWQAWIGAGLAVAGTALIFMS